MMRIPVAWCAVLALAAGCTATMPEPPPGPAANVGQRSASGDATASTVAGTSSATITPGSSLLATGVVLAVKIDNTGPARPRVGLDAADIVYVEPVEAGLTRLLAIFSSTKPPEVGPIRSARESDATLLANYGRVAFAYSGASTITATAIAGGSQVNVSMDAGALGYRRDRSRPAPYNVMGDPAALIARAGGSVSAGDIGFRVGPVAPGSRPATSVSTAYSSARIGFTWDAAVGRYLMTTDGKPEVTAAGVRVGAATVVVQIVRTHLSANRDVNGVATPVLDVVGSGAVQVLRDGQLSTGRWSRSSATSPTELTTSTGGQITVAPGPLFVLLVPEGQSVTVP